MICGKVKRPSLITRGVLRLFFFVELPQAKLRSVCKGIPLFENVNTFDTIFCNPPERIRTKIRQFIEVQTVRM